MRFLHKNRQVLVYGLSLALLLFILKWLEFRLVLRDHAVEAYVGVIALIFTALGGWLALKLSKPKLLVVEKKVQVGPSVEFIRNSEEAQRLGLSRRELEVLECMALGLSNQEISERLFVSLPTVKSHSSNLFSKLDAKRRTQAVEKARQLGIIP